MIDLCVAERFSEINLFQRITKLERSCIGTYFIAYSSRLWVIEQMLKQMFVGVPPGSYDRLLDFSTTRGLFSA